MTTSASSAEQRAATRKALARKMAARKRSATDPVPDRSPGPVPAGSHAVPAGSGPVPAGSGGGRVPAAGRSPVTELVLERARPEVITIASARRSAAPVAPMGHDAIETIEVRSPRRSRFASPDGRRLLMGPRLRRVEVAPVPRPDSEPEEGDGGARFVAPGNPLSRRRTRRRWERRGFVPVSPGRTPIRHRILPRTVIGICTMLLAFGVGVGFSGAAFYAYYDQRLARNEETVARFVEGFDRQFTDAVGAMDDLRVQAVDDIRSELVPLGDYVTDANGVVTLPVTAGPSVWQLETRDEAGQILTGSAFAVAPHGDGGTAMITSYSLIVASTTTPGPAIELVKRGQRIPAQLWAWDADRDLALLVVDEAITPLPLAGDADQMSAVGARLFAVGGVGGQGATASPGVLLDHSQSGLQHTVAVGTLFQGGPLVDGSGRVLGVATLGYRPYGIDPGQVLQAPDVAIVCARLLSCAETTDDRLAIEVAGDAPSALAPSDGVEDGVGEGADAGATTPEPGDN